MSHMLEFPPRPLPPSANSSPFVNLGIYGTDITSSLPPLIPLNLVLHFAPALRKWMLPTRDAAYLPTSSAWHTLRTPYVDIDILAPIEAVGLVWIITRMLHLGGAISHRETFSVHPNLATSLAIHNAWLALELPVEGLRVLHTHIQAQLMLGSLVIRRWDMRMLWDTFPHDSEIVRAMGLNFLRAHVNMDYKPQESFEIHAWFKSTPELYAFFKSLREAVPARQKDREVTVPAMEEKEKIIGTGRQTIGRKAGKKIKAAVTAQAAGQVGIMERGTTRKVSPQERKEREASDFEALKTRLRRTRSDDSLRSVDTAIWDPQTPEEDEWEEEGPVTTDMNDSSNYSNGDISTALARSLETIRVRRESRVAKNNYPLQRTADSLILVNPELRVTWT